VRRPQGDVAGFAAAVVDLMDNHERRAALVAEAAQVARRFDWEQIARDELDMIGR